MKGFTVRVLVLASLGLGVRALPARAQSTSPTPAAVRTAPAQQQVQQVREELERLKKEFDALRQTYDQRISVLEQRIGDLAGPSVVLAPVAPVAPAALVVPDPPVQTTPPASQNLAATSKIFNPDMSVIGNFLGIAGKNRLSAEPSMQVTEAEMALQAIVDPYARADFFLAAGPEGLEIEEGFITFNSLPGRFLVKVGKIRASFGKVNTLHTHAMPTADRPLVTGNLVGGEEGISDSGFSVSRLIPNAFMFLEATGEVFRGDSLVFQTSQRSRLNYVARLRGYRDLTEGSNLDLGVSFAHGPTDRGLPFEEGTTEVANVLNKRLIGFDATFRYRPLRRANYNRFQARTEFIWSRQQMPDGPHVAAFGFYGLTEYQMNRRWYVGARYDRSARALDVSLHDTGGSFFVTFWPSEFSQIRTQFRRTSFAEGIKANELLFQFNFAIGAHGAHVF